MRRYKFLTKDSINTALNKLRKAFIVANNLETVKKITKGILTQDERMKIGRRIQIVQMLKSGLTYRQIREELKVGVNTIMLVERKMQQNPECFNLILDLKEKVVIREKPMKAFQSLGGSKLIFKKRIYD